MDIYEVTIKGTFKTVTFQVMAYGIWDTWEQYDELMSSPDFPKGVGRTLELNMRYISPLQVR